MIATVVAAGAGFTHWESRLASPPAARDRSSGAALLATIGATQPMAADWFWLKANLAWEIRDEDATRHYARLANACAPAVPYFRVNTARMMAFDFPEWRHREKPLAPAALVQRWRSEAADEAIAWLMAGSPPFAPALWIEAGNIALYGKEDPLAAAAFYRVAAECPDAPWHAGRICAELLRRAGRRQEAVDWLREWLPRVPPEDPDAQRALVERRLAEWERELAEAEAL